MIITFTVLNCAQQCNYREQKIRKYLIFIPEKHQTTFSLVHLNFRAGLTFPVPVCTVSPGLWVNKADTQ